MIGDRGFGLVSILDALDPTVVHVHDAVAEIKDADVMSDHDDGPAGLDGDAAKEFHHSSARLTVEGSRRFITHQQSRLVPQCSGNAHALLLPPGHPTTQTLQTLTSTN